MFDNTVSHSYKLCPNSFDSTLPLDGKKSISISHVNVRSLNKNVDSLKVLYEDCVKFRFDVIALSEAGAYAGGGGGGGVWGETPPLEFCLCVCFVYVFSENPPPLLIFFFFFFFF